MERPDLGVLGSFFLAQCVLCTDVYRRVWRQEQPRKRLSVGSDYSVSESPE